MVKALKISMETTRFWLKEFILSVLIRIDLFAPNIVIDLKRRKEHYGQRNPRKRLIYGPANHVGA